MEVGESKVTNMLLRMLGSDIINEIDNYINGILFRNFVFMSSILQVKKIFAQSLDDFFSNVSQEELMNLRSYTGYNFRNINALLRNTWTYQINGMLSKKKQEELKKHASIISNVLVKFNIPQIDFVTFRGTTLDSFSSYGINELQQLESLTGKFLYEQGFTSTSILEETCYFNKILEDGKFYNVKIKYLVPSEWSDGGLLINNSTSYSINQNELLIDKGSLSKVVDVKIDNNTAILTVVLIPKEIYDLDYKKNIADSKSK